MGLNEAEGQIEDEDEIRGTPEDYKRWMSEIKNAERECKDWWGECDKISRIYANQTHSGKQRDFMKSRPKFNVLWSNIQTLKPSTYSALPKPQIERRFSDPDPVSRVGAEIWERTLKSNNELVGLDEVLRDITDDFLLFARGTPWVRYVPTFEDIQQEKQIIGPDGFPQVVTEMVSTLTKERVETDFVGYRDFLHSPARKWREVRWVARRVFMTRKQCRDRFGEKGNAVELTYSPKGMDESSDDYQIFKRAELFEIWCKDTKTVYWVSKGLKDDYLDAKKDPLNLDGFFPCPKPCYGTQTAMSLIPIPEYCIWGDLAQELDRVVGQIAELTKALRVMGVYDESIPELRRLVTEGRDGDLIPVKDWTGFQQKGGLSNAMEMMPLKDLVDALARLYDTERNLKEFIYEISGFSDILRGQSDSSETATAQQLKGQFAAVRLRDRQREMQRMCRDLIEIQAEIIAEQFGDQTLAEMSGAQLLNPQDQQLFSQAVAQLRQDGIRRYRIDIETDSTLALDQDLEKQRRIEFVDAMTSAMQNLLPVMKEYPSLAPFVGEAISFVSRGLGAGRTLEQSLTTGIQQAMQQSMTPPPPPQVLPPQPPPGPTPEQMMAEQAKIAQQDRKIDSDVQVKMRKIDTDAAIAAQKLDRMVSVEMAKLQSKEDLDVAKMRLNQLNVYTP